MFRMVEYRRRRFPGICQGFPRKEKSIPGLLRSASRSHPLLAVQRDVLFPEHFIKETASGFLQIFFQIFIKPLSALVGADGHFSHGASFHMPEYTPEDQMEMALIRENTAFVCVSSTESSFN